MPAAPAAMLKNSVLPRLLKKVQMQGGTPKPERGVLEVRRSEWRGGPTPQMGLFQQPGYTPYSAPKLLPQMPEQIRRVQRLPRHCGHQLGGAGPLAGPVDFLAQPLPERQEFPPAKLLAEVPRARPAPLQRTARRRGFRACRLENSQSCPRSSGYPGDTPARRRAGAHPRYRTMRSFQAAGKSAAARSPTIRACSSSKRNTMWRLYVASSASTQMKEDRTSLTAKTRPSRSTPARASGNA